MTGLIPSAPIGQRRVRVLNDPLESAKRVAPTPQPITNPVVQTALSNIRVNDPTGQLPYTGNTQMEPTVAGNGDTLVCGFTDSQGFFGTGTLTGYAISFDAGQTWYDAGSLPRLGSGHTETVLGDATMVTDKQGYWYCLSLYDVGNGAVDPGDGDIGVVLHRGRFVGTNLIWSAPRLLAGGAAGDRLDSPHLGIDRALDRLYVTYTYTNLVLNLGWGQVEVLTLASHGATTLQRVVVQPHTVNTNNAGGRVAVGPDGEVYCVWESGLLSNSGLGPAYQKIAKSTDHGLTFQPAVTAAVVNESWLSGPPGFNREEESVEFPSIAVDCSNGPRRGRVYLTWHDGAAMTFPSGPVFVTETAAWNNAPSAAQVLPTAPTLQIDGSTPSGDPVDWYRFSGTAGEHVRFIVRPNNYLGLRASLRWPDAVFADTTLAASARRTGDWVFFLFTLPATGDYLISLERRAYTGTYTAWLGRTGTTQPSLAIDHRDIALVSSPGGVSSWTPKLRVNDDTGFNDQAFPEVVVDGAGGAHVTWYDRRFDPRTHVLADLMLASTFDGGATFTPNIRVTTQSSYWQGDALNPADAVPNFGDRFLPLADGERLFPLWADGRLQQPDVMIAPLRTGFTLTTPAYVRARTGQGLGLPIDVRNETPYDDAVFQVEMSFEAHSLSDTVCTMGPIPSGEHAAMLYDPTVWGNVQHELPFIAHVTVTSNRSATVRSNDVWVINDQVPVTLADFAAEIEADGVHLTWKAPDATSFDVEWAANVAGPYAQLNAAPVTPASSTKYEYIDAAPIAAGASRSYRLVAVESNGHRSLFGPWTIEGAAVPRNVALLGAHPNPFNPSASIRFELPRAGAVSLRILDVRGRVVTTLAAGTHFEAGLHALGWDGRDAQGLAQPSGVYLAELQALGVRQATRLVLLR